MAPRPPIDVDTPNGPARLTLHDPDAPDGPPRGTLVLGHGAGGGIGAPDLVAVTAAAVGDGWRVGLVEQPWRVAGKRVASPPPRLDQSWLAVLEHVRAAGIRSGPLVVGGRSAGARVACRTADATGAAAVLCLAFPLHPPGRPERSRAAELELGRQGGRPVYVVQGRRDAFGTPQDVEDAVGRLTDLTVLAVDADHALRTDLRAVCAGVTGWLAGLPGAG